MHSLNFKTCDKFQNSMTMAKSIKSILPNKHIRIYHEAKGGMEKSVMRITIWHHKACQVMTNGDRVGQIFLSHPHTNNGFFFLLTNKYS